MCNLTKEQVEQKVVSYAKSVDWDFDKVKDYVNYEICPQWYRLLDGCDSKDIVQIIIDRFKPKEEGKPVEKVFTITREALGEIYGYVCDDWEGEINDILNTNSFKNKFEVGEGLVNKARCEKFLNSVQREWLDKYFPKPKKKKIELVVGLDGGGKWGGNTGYKNDLYRYNPKLLNRDYCEYEGEYYDLIWCEASEGLSCLFLGRWNDGVSTDED